MLVHLTPSPEIVNLFSSEMLCLCHAGKLMFIATISIQLSTRISLSMCFWPHHVGQGARSTGVSWRVSQMKDDDPICNSSNLVMFQFHQFQFQLLFRNWILTPTLAYIQGVVINWKWKENATSFSLPHMWNWSMYVVLLSISYWYGRRSYESAFPSFGRYRALKQKVVMMPTLLSLTVLAIIKTCNTVSDDKVVIMSNLYLQCPSSDNV